MRFLDCMSTPPGRVVRVFLGLALVALGLAVVQGIAGVAIAAFGLVPLTTAIVNVCPIRPLVERLPLPCHPRGLQVREMATTRQWHPTACILCECNCGLEVERG